MKNQYFGDRRDYFKYDLLLDLAEGIDSIERLTIIPMLTPDDNTREGRFTEYPVGNRRPDLHRMLRDQLHSRCRDISGLASLLKGKELHHHSPKEAASCFAQHSRTCYFEEVPDNTLQSSVVFLDPDIGLPPRKTSLPPKKNLDKYLLWTDVAQIADRMSPCSLLVIYQHLQFDKRKVDGDIRRRCEILARRTGAPRVGYITDRDIAFLVTSRDIGVYNRAITVLCEHGMEHNLQMDQVLNT